MAKQICESEPDVRRKVEKPRVKNVGDIENDTRETGLKKQ